MGSKNSSQQTQTQSTYALPQASADYDTVMAKAQAAANLPYTPYAGELTAGNNAEEKFAGTAAYEQNVQSTDQYNAAKMYTTNAAGDMTNPIGVANNIGAYQSPYTQSVINATMAQAQQNDAIQANQQTSNAIGAHAFGGDRAGIAQAVLGGQQALANNQTVAQLNNQGYAQALAAAENQQGVQLQNDQANRANIMAGGQQYANIESNRETTQLQNLNEMMQSGVLQQQTQQAADTAKYGQFEQAQAFPYVQSNFLAGITDATAPLYGSTSTGTNTTQTNGANSILGGVLGIAGLFSDARLKTDIRPIGKSYDGQTLYQFRYKDDPRAVHVGLLAQEVEHHAPHAVGEHRGAKVVEYGAALRKAADKGHFASGGVVGMRPRMLRYADGGAADYGLSQEEIDAGSDPRPFDPSTQSHPHLPQIAPIPDGPMDTFAYDDGGGALNDRYARAIDSVANQPSYGGVEDVNEGVNSHYFAHGGVVGLRPRRAVGGGIMGARPRLALGGTPYGGNAAAPYGSNGSDPYASQSFIPQVTVKPAQMLNTPLHFSSAGGGDSSGQQMLQQGTKAFKGAMNGGGLFGSNSSTAASDAAQNASEYGIGGGAGLGGLASGVGSLGSGVGDLFSGLGFRRGGVVGMRRRLADGGDTGDDSGGGGGKDDDTDIGDLPDTGASFIPNDQIDPAKPLVSNMTFPSSGGGGGSGGGSSGGKGGGILSMFGMAAGGAATRRAAGGVVGRRGYDDGGVVDDLAFPQDDTPPAVPDVPVIEATPGVAGRAPSTVDDFPPIRNDGKTDAASIPVPAPPSQAYGTLDGARAGLSALGSSDASPSATLTGADSDTPLPPARPAGLGVLNADPAKGPITDPNAPPVAVYPASGPGAYTGTGPVPTAAAAGQQPYTMAKVSTVPGGTGVPSGGVLGNTPVADTPSDGGGVVGDASTPSASSGVMGTASAYAPPSAAAAASPGLAAINAAAPVGNNASGRAFGFGNTVNRTLGFEGGYSPSDNGGGPVNFGINQDAHPGMNVRNLTRNDAVNIYKRDYWDAIGGDKLNPALAHVAFDTAVMSGPQRANQMIAQSGGDPNKFMDLREAYQQRLIQNNPGKFGPVAANWARRNAGLRSDLANSGVTSAGVPGNDQRGAPAPSGGVVGTSTADPRSRGLLAQAGEDMSRASTPPSRLSDYFGPNIGGTGQYTEGHSGGIFGLLPGMKDSDRLALASLGFGMAASPSKSLGMAIGQGGLAAVKTLQGQQANTREDALAKARIANDGSEMGLRTGELKNQTARTSMAQQELAAQLAKINQELKYGPQKAEADIAHTQAGTGAVQAETYARTHTFTPQGIAISDPSKPNDPPRMVPYSSMNGGAASGATAQPDASGSAGPVIEQSGYVHPPATIPINPMNFSKEGQQQVGKLSTDTMEGARIQYEKSQNAKASLDQMSHALAGIPSTGFLAAGAGQNERVNIAKNLNAALSTLGVDPKNQIDPGGIASSEEAKKLAFRMGGDLATSLGGREPGFIVQQAVGAVPSSENSPLGAQRIVAGLRATAQRQEDRYRYLTEYQQRNGGDLTGADEAFNRANPPSRYVGQAILSTVPQGAQDMLRQHPEKRAMFEQKYGRGTADYVLGQ